MAQAHTQGNYNGYMAARRTLLPCATARPAAPSPQTHATSSHTLPYSTIPDPHTRTQEKVAAHHREHKTPTYTPLIGTLIRTCGQNVTALRSLSSRYH